MNLLASILPGLRDLRAPVAAGYLWLLNIWLIFGSEIHIGDSAQGVLGRLYPLEGLNSTIGVGIVISFTAYLIGAVSESVSSSVLRAIGTDRSASPWRYVKGRFDEGLDLLRRQRPSRALVTRILWEIDPVLSQINVAIEDAPEDASGGQIVDRAGEVRIILNRSSWTPADYEQEIDRRMPGLSADDKFRFHVLAVYHTRTFERAPDRPDQRIGRRYVGTPWAAHLLPGAYPDEFRFFQALGKAGSDDMNLVRARLLAEQTTLYGEYDRMESEAQFRAAVVPPLAFLVVTVTFLQFLQWGVESLLWLLTLAPLVVLSIDAVRRQLRANEVLLQAVDSGKVKSPLLEALERDLPKSKQGAMQDEKGVAGSRQSEEAKT